MQVSCQNTGTLIVGRVLNGFTVGITSSQVAVYLAEIAKAEKRGSLVIVQQLAIEFGILIMYFMAMAVHPSRVLPVSGPHGELSSYLASS